MAYAQLKTDIAAVIRNNGNQEITGNVLQGALLEMINALGANYQYAGVADTSTTITTTEANVFYLLTEAGTYSNMSSSIVHTSGIGIALWDGTAWSYQNVPSSTVVATDATPTENSTNPIQSGWAWTKENGELLYSRASGSVTTAVNYNFDISTYQIGTIFRVHIDSLSDTASIIFAVTDGTNNLSRVRSLDLATGQDYYFVKRTTNATKIRFYKTGISTGHTWDFSIYKCDKIPQNADISNDYTYAENNSVQFLSPSHSQPLTTGKIGEYATQQYYSASELQYNRGTIFTITYNSATYQVSLIYNYYNSEYFTVIDKASGSVIDTSQFQVWALTLRHKTYQEVSEDAINTLVTYTNISGIKYNKGADPSFVQSYVNKTFSADSLAYTSINIAKKPFIHHNENETDYAYIPAQSLMDISFAKTLGADFIEANTHKCSDGVYVVKHGNNGALGAGLIFADGSGLSSSTQFSSVTSTALRQYVTYNSRQAKYKNLHIPTLDEFCAECASKGIGVLLQIVDGGELPIARKYLLDQNIIAYNLSDRGDFKGTIIMYGNATKAQILAYGNRYGLPFAYSKSDLSSMSDANIIDLANAMHSKGYILGTAYASPNLWHRLHKLGVDFNAATYQECNPFYLGTLANIVNDTNGLTLSSGVTFDTTAKTFTMPQSSTIKLSNADANTSLSKANVNIRYNGTLTIMFGRENVVSSSGFVALQSDGQEDVQISYYCYKYPTIVYILADEATTIYDLSIHASKIL